MGVQAQVTFPATLQRAPKRRQVYEFIVAEQAAGRGFPSYRTIADHMGWKQETSAYSALDMLHHLDGVLNKDVYGSPPRRFFLKEIAG